MAMEIGNVEAGTHEPSPHDENSQTKPDSDEPMVQLSKYILLLATLVATVTYAAGFNPPGGVWQDTDYAAGHLAGDPIIRANHKLRYMVFFYCNATAFASSLLVIVLVLFLALLHEKKIQDWTSSVYPLRVVMVLDLISLMGAYAASTCRDLLTTIYSSVLVAIVLIYLVIQMVWAQLPEDQAYKLVLKEWLRHVRMLLSWPPQDDEASVDPVLMKRQPEVLPPDEAAEKLLKKRHRKVLMLLATFAVSVTYVAGMSTPGGFWDNDAEGGHRPGDAILKDRHGARLTVFLCFNTMAFVASLLIVVVLLNRNYQVNQAYGWITVALISLVGAYTAGSCRETDTTVYVVSLVGAVLLVITFLQTVFPKIKRGCCCKYPCSSVRGPSEGEPARHCNSLVQQWWHCNSLVQQWWWQGPPTNQERKEAEKARSLVLLLATLAATITYQAGLDPPGGVWSENGDGHMAGDPILLTTNPRRYKAFHYCNSVAFVASLVAIILVKTKLMFKTHVLEAVMILDLFGLIGAYAAGSCRNVSTSIYAMALAGAVLVYVVIHVVFFTLHLVHTKIDDDLVEKRRKRLLLFAVLAATITYQAGLTPPGGFLLQDDNMSDRHHVGDPVLLYNFPRRYMAFFYCNSVSFMLSISLIILLVNPHLYRPAIRSYALAVCTAAGLFGLMGAYAAGSTQHIRTSIYIFVLVAVVLFVVAVLLLVFIMKERNRRKSNRITAANTEIEPSRGAGNNTAGEPSSQLEEPAVTDDEDKATKKHAKRKYLMLLGILVASVTYQAGLDPPGGAWQRSSDGHDAGNPVLHDNRRPRYLTFFYSNSASFVASIVVIILLLPRWRRLKEGERSLKAMNTVILLDLLALLGAYAAGSSRRWKTSVYVVALVIAVLAYVVIHIVLAFLCPPPPPQESSSSQGTQ